MKRTVGEQAWRQRKCDRDSGDHDVKRTLDGERDDQHCERATLALGRMFEARPCNGDTKQLTFAERGGVGHRLGSSNQRVHRPASTPHMPPRSRLRRRLQSPVWDKQHHDQT